MQKYTPIAFEINLHPEGFVFDVGSLMAALMGLKDLRDARGLRYGLVTVLVYVILAKLSGEDFLRGIAQWIKERKEILASVLGLAKPQTPCYTTYGRMLGRAVDGEHFEQVTRAFFAGLPGAGRTILIALDGKTLRGTLPFGAPGASISSPPSFRVKAWCSPKWRLPKRKTRFRRLRACSECWIYGAKSSPRTRC
jgi:hypothetical protein